MKHKTFLVFLLLALLAAGMAHDLTAETESKKSERPRFYIKFDGLGSLSTAGNFGDFIDIEEAYLDDLALLPAHEMSITKDPYFMGFTGEIGVQVKKHAVGISVGYLKKSLTYTQHSELNSGLITDTEREYRFAAIPIFLFIRYKLLELSFIDGFVTVGEGVYLTTYSDDFNTTNSSGTVLSDAGYIEGRKNSLAFHAGITLDFKITKFLALSMDAGYRLSSMKEPEGVNYSLINGGTGVLTEGTLYYGADQLKTNATTLDLEDNVGDTVEPVPAVFNMNGFSLSAGLKLIF